MAEESSASEVNVHESEYTEIVKNTWKILMAQENEVGQNIYEHVVTKEIEVSRLFMDTKLGSQSVLFMKMLDGVITLCYHFVCVWVCFIVSIVTMPSLFFLAM